MKHFKKDGVLKWKCFFELSKSTLSSSVYMRTEFADSIFRHYNPAVLSFGEAMQGGLTKRGLVYEE